MLSPKLMNGDLVIENGELALIDGAEEIAQSCEHVLGTNRGEWFLNPLMGIEFSKLNGKMISEDMVREQIRQGLRQEPRIATIEDISVNLDARSRRSEVTFKATAVSGEVVQGGIG